VVGWQWADEQMLNFGGDPDHRLDTGIVFRICPYWEIWKTANRHSFILIRQMMALVRRPLVEVCTVPMLVVYVCAETDMHVLDTCFTCYVQWRRNKPMLLSVTLRHRWHSQIKVTVNFVLAHITVDCPGTQPWGVRNLSQDPSPFVNPEILGFLQPYTGISGIKILKCC